MKNPKCGSRHSRFWIKLPKIFIMYHWNCTIRQLSAIHRTACILYIRLNRLCKNKAILKNLRSRSPFLLPLSQHGDDGYIAAHPEHILPQTNSRFVYKTFSHLYRLLIFNQSCCFYSTENFRRFSSLLDAFGTGDVCVPSLFSAT